MKYIGLIIMALVAAAGLVARTGPGHAVANVYTVNSTYGGPIPPATTPPATDFDTSDNVCETESGNGVCTLRAAIEQANSPTSAGLDTIAFNIPTTDPGYNSITQTFHIQPSSALPVIGDPVIIDGRTQPEFTVLERPVIELSGLTSGSLVDGLHITAGNSTVRGLIINKFGITDGSDGIELQGGGNNLIEGNFIGVDVNGIVTDPNSFVSGDEFGNNGSGIFINGSADNAIGGTRPTPGISCFGATNPCNLISGNHQGTPLSAHGIEISGAGATGNVIKGNFIGVDFGGPESGYLCLEGSPGFPGPVQDDDNDGAINDGCPQVGPAAESGTQCGANASDNDGDGVINDGCPAVFGTRKSIGNKGDGVNITGVTNNTVGGGAAGDGNVITSNQASGVRIFGGPEAGTACLNASDNDADGAVNDGCPMAGGTAESGSQCANNTNDDSADDSLVNDGCPAVAVANGNRLEGNLIGPGSDGQSIPGGRAIVGVIVDGAPGNFVGTVGGARNVVSGNGDGIQIQGAGATGNFVQNNYVGTDVTGASDLGNAFSGVIVSSSASNNTVGGTDPGARNVISGNDQHGLEVNSGATGNLVQGNYIGTNAAGNAELPNGASGGRGISISGAPGNTIGGSAAARNVISGNSGYGIDILGSGADSNVVQSNYIGTNAAGTAPVGNRQAGVYVDGAPNTIVGGTTPALRNVISGNGQASVLVAAPGVVINGAGATGTKVRGNFIGTDSTGSAALANLATGVLIIGAPNNTVGGTAGTTPGGPCTGACNVISGNGIHGIEIDTAAGTGNVVLGNYIGLNVSGGAGLGNAGDGVFISDAPANTIGGTGTGSANVISANGQAGVHILNLGAGASANVVQGNYIGTDAGGGLDRGNTQHGVWIDGAPNNVIGGTTTGARNVISGNNGTGVTIQGGGASGNLVRGNRIGTDAAGTGVLGNTSGGTRISGNASANSVGGTVTGAGNTIANNGAGVVIDSGTGNSVLSNSIHSSGSLGINLGTDGVTANDLDDPDTGANNLQNYPALSSALSGTYGTTLAGSLNSIASTAFTLQFFANSSCDSSGYGEGATLLGTFNFNTNSGGDVNFSQFIPLGGFAGQSISATATDPAGNTSEFAQCVTAVFTADSDGDGVCDGASPVGGVCTAGPDNCPVTQNPGQQNTDGDSAGNACDNCPTLSSPDQTDSDSDGLGNPCDPDDDNDGVPDGADNCPLAANPDQANADSDAQGDACDPDDDNDTVPDVTDNCPLFPNLDQADTDGDGLGDVCDGGLGYYHPLVPYRILDTRSGPQGVPAGKLQNNSEITVDVTGGPSGVPATNVSAVVINATVTEPTMGSYLTVYPTGVPRPLASNLNFSAGQTVPNLVTVKVGIDGNVKVYNNTGQVHVIFDVVGWYGGPSGGSRYNALTPARILDTRTGPQGIPAGSVDQNETVAVDVTGVGGVPANATAVVLNVTATQPTTGSFLTVYPSDTSLPVASNLNFNAGQTVPNLVIVKVGADGNVKLYNKLGSVHVIFDVVGWYGATGDLFYPLTPARVLDTRFGPQGTPPGKVGNGATVTADVTVGDVPSTASGIVVNTTVTEPTQGSYLTVWPSGVGRPLASNLNFSVGQTVPNLVIVKVGSGGNVQVYNDNGQVHVIFDAVGYFAP